MSILFTQKVRTVKFLYNLLVIILIFLFSKIYHLYERELIEMCPYKWRIVHLFLKMWLRIANVGGENCDLYKCIFHVWTSSPNCSVDMLRNIIIWKYT